MVDAIWNKIAMASCIKREKITVIDGFFTDRELPGKIGTVDAVIFFDILLHLVSPNWDEVLKMYSKFTESFLIVNPQFFNSTTTVRLLDFGTD